MKSKDPTTRLLAAEKLGEQKDVRAVEPLAFALRDENKFVRKAAAEALERIGDARAVEPLVAALSDDKSSVRLPAAEALGQIGDARAVEPLVAALSDSARVVRESAAEALGDIDPNWEKSDAARSAVQELLKALEDRDRDVRWWAAGLLGKIGDLRALEPLIHALQDDDWLVRCSTAEALGRIGDSRAVEPLIDALHDEDSSVRWATVEALGGLGDSRAIDPLIEVALSGEDTRHQERARESLVAIDPASIGRLSAARDERALAVDPERKGIHALLHSGEEFTEANPIRLKETDATIYYHEGRGLWVLSIPIAAAGYGKRLVAIDPDLDPDKFVTDALREAPSWNLGTTPEGRLYELMKSDWVFDYHNPIVVGRVAHVFYEDGEWWLAVSVSPEALKRIEMARIAPIDKGIDEAVIDAIAAYGLSLMRER